ncbi:unnamed protein product [Dicrocoelium dendriticum]|nr:unnamed protein product [Dicrocoelium dendriticum]
MKPQQHEKKLAIENCVRSFIIKSIHAIVQARNGIVYNTNCISAVGARNNLMVNIEEDPEIGATIKQTLDAGFPVRVRDVLSLEILTAWPTGERMVVEVWRFRLDTADRLNVSSEDDQSSQASPSTEQATASGTTTDMVQTNEVAVEDLRQSRLFEKLGTLLKAVIVATRLLPAYRLSRSQDPSKYQMCYTLRRGLTNLSRLGPNAMCQQIGRLFSGLAVSPVNSEGAASQDTPDSAGLVFLSCTVHYRPTFPPFSEMEARIRTKSALFSDEAPGSDANQNTKRPNRFSLPCKPRSPFDPSSSELGHANRPFSRVRPAFSDHHVDDHLDEEIQSHEALFPPDYGSPHRQTHFFNLWPNENEVAVGKEEDDYLGQNEEHEHCDRYVSDLNDTIHPKYQSNKTPEDEEAVDHATNTNTPLQLPFSTVGVSGDRLTHLFVELRERADLDLFRVPLSNLGSGDACPSSQVQSSLFDADALSDELERHEKILKEFDDFVVGFCHLESFGPEIRPLAPNPLATALPTHYKTEQ